jgi:hypothetical protein
MDLQIINGYRDIRTLTVFLHKVVAPCNILMNEIIT